MCGLSNLWVCVCLGFVMCEFVQVCIFNVCVYVWVLYSLGA